MRTQTQLHFGAIAALAAVSGAHAQNLHPIDFAMRLHGSNPAVIQTGLINDQGFAEFPGRVIRGAAAGGFNNVWFDPGFDSPAGTFPPNTPIRLDLLGALREWDGEDFDLMSGRQLGIFQGVEVRTPLESDELAPGVLLGTAAGNGIVHEHATMFFTDSFRVSGMWLFQVILDSSDPGIAPSEPAYIVLHQDMTEEEIDRAVAWTQANRVDACRDADIDGSGSADFFDLLALDRDFYRPETPTLTADFDRDLLNTPLDFVEFVSLLDSGCAE